MAARRVVVADDDPLVRMIIVALVAVHEHLDLVGQASSGAEGISMTLALQPDWLIADYDLGDMPADDVVAQVRGSAPDTRILLHSGRGDIHEIGVGLGVDRSACKNEGLRQLEEHLVGL